MIFCIVVTQFAAPGENVLFGATIIIMVMIALIHSSVMHPIDKNDRQRRQNTILHPFLAAALDRR
jgi:hypothetical protein